MNNGTNAAAALAPFTVTVSVTDQLGRVRTNVEPCASWDVANDVMGLYLDNYETRPVRATVEIIEAGEVVAEATVGLLKASR
jgi:hypothetical protein